MRTLFASILSLIIFLASFQNTLILIDYKINRSFYENYCINKNKPELDCHGKCQVKEQSESKSSPTELIKISFEFNILPSKTIEIPTRKILLSELKSESFYTSIFQIQKGFYKILPHPPHNLV